MELKYKPGFVNYSTPMERALAFAKGIDAVVEDANNGFASFVTKSDVLVLLMALDVIKDKATGNTAHSIEKLQMVEKHVDRLEEILMWAGLSHAHDLGVTERSVITAAWRSNGTRQQRVIKIMKFLEWICTFVGYAKEKLDTKA